MNKRLESALRKPRLSGLAETLHVRLEEATAGRLTHAEFLELILQDELAVRGDRQIQRRTKAAAFRELKTLDQFDFAFNPSINKKQIYDLATCRFIREAKDVLWLGPPGVGKSFLAHHRRPRQSLRAIRDVDLSNTSAYTGTTTIDSATLRITGDNRLPARTAVEFAHTGSGAVLELGGHNQTIGSMSDNEALHSQVDLDFGAPISRRAPNPDKPDGYAAIFRRLRPGPSPPQGRQRPS